MHTIMIICSSTCFAAARLLAFLLVQKSANVCSMALQFVLELVMLMVLGKEELYLIFFFVYMRDLITKVTIVSISDAVKLTLF